MMDIGFVVLLCAVALVGFGKVYFQNRLNGRDQQIVSAKPQSPEQIVGHALTCKLGSFEVELAAHDQASGQSLIRELRRFSAVLATNTDHWFPVPDQLRRPWRDLVRSYADYHRLTEALLGSGGEFQTQASAHLTGEDVQAARRRYDAAYRALFDEKPTFTASASVDVADLHLLKARHGRVTRVFRRDGEKVDRGLGSNEFT